jgi:methyl-accepting chemotaxis protein
VTGDAQYKQMYDDVIAIRDGVKARPDGTTISLVELMRRLEFSDAEFAALDRAKAESDGLVQLETTAMNVPSDAAPADHERAIQMLHSPEYAKFKADIMLPVGEFFALLDQRIEDRVGAAEQNVFLSRIAMIVAGALLLGMAVATGLIMTRKVTRRIGGLNGSMQSLVAGDLAVGVPYLDDTDEVGAMAVAVGTFRENAIKIAALSEDERRRSSN